MLFLTNDHIKAWRGRSDANQVTFLNNQGTQGLQFAAVGGKGVSTG